MATAVKKRKRLALAPFDRKATPVAHLLRAHRQFRPRGSLPRNLGDGFLCALNQVYANVRREAIRRGFRFSDRLATDLARDYYAFPLMSLDEVIDAREFPYRPNARWLEILEKRAPGKFTITELKRGELQFNYLFHESAHGIAHDEFFGRRSLRKTPRNARALLAVMLGEAYANTVECLASSFEAGEIANYFLDANCHFRANEREVRALRLAIRRFGFATTARVLMGAFLYANYLFERLGPVEIRQIARFAGLPASAPIERLARIGTELNADFRATTTPLHLLKTGFGPNLRALFRGDPLRRLQQPGNRDLVRKAHHLVDIAVRDAQL